VLLPLPPLLDAEKMPGFSKTALALRRSRGNTFPAKRNYANLPQKRMIPVLTNKIKKPVLVSSKVLSSINF